MIVISSLVMSIVESEPSGFRITVKQSITTGVLALIWLAADDIYKKLRVSCLAGWSGS